MQPSGSTDISAPVILSPDITVVVHPVDTAVHPSYPPGYRWAVMAGGKRPADLDYCVQAGHERNIDMAMMAGESHGAAATKALRLLGIPALYGVLRLAWDPLPAEADERPLAIWSGEKGDD